MPQSTCSFPKMKIGQFPKLAHALALNYLPGLLVQILTFEKDNNKRQLDLEIGKTIHSEK